jgi:hypothetical protein
MATTTDRNITPCHTLGLTRRLCAHCRQPIDGPPLRRGSIHLHPACFRDYVPRTPSVPADFVPQYKARGETVLDVRWTNFLAKYKRGDAGITPTHPRPPRPSITSPVNCPGNLKDGIGFAGGTCHARGKGKHAAPKPTPRSTSTRRASDPEVFRQVPDMKEFWVAPDGRVERRPPAATRYLLAGLNGPGGDRDKIRLLIGGNYRDISRAELVKAAFGDAPAEGGVS